MKSPNRPSPFDQAREFSRSGEAAETHSPLSPTRASRFRNNGSLRPRPVTRHYYFDGHGHLEAVLSYFDPRAEEPGTRKAIVA